MKICHLTSVHQYKDIRIFIKECQTLSKAGFEVHLVAPNAPNNVVDDVQIHGIEKEIGNRFNRMTKIVKCVYQKALEIDAEIYHFHDPELIPVGMKLKKRGKKVIYDIHEDTPRAILSKHWISPLVRFPLAKTFEVFENFHAKKFDALIGATPYIAQRFININKSTHNINNFPLSEELSDQMTKSFNNKKKSVCYIGGIGEKRGVNEVLNAANLIRGNIEFAGPVSNNIEKDLIRHNNVVYHGILNRIEVKNLLSNSVAGIVTFLPEPNHINAQPNKMFEYMSAGIPVICSDFPLWREIIEKNNCGICVNPEDPVAIANAINYLIDNPEIAEGLGQNGRNAVLSDFNWESEGLKLINIYKCL